MIDGISSMSSYQPMSGTSGPKGPPGGGGNAFQTSDIDQNGSISQTELESLAAGIEETTGTTIDVEEALSSFDTDGDGGLSGEELYEMLGSYGFEPPEVTDGESEASGSPPPPPPPQQMEAALSAYGQNSGTSETESLLDLLDEDTETEDETSS